jgi:hypothetical protein
MTSTDSIDTDAPSPDEIRAAANAFAVGRYADAATLALDLTKRFPRHYFGWKLLGSAYGQLGQPTAALAPLRKAVAIRPHDEDVHSNLGVFLSDIGQFDAAIESYRRTLEISPDYVEAHNNLGWLFCKLGHFDQAALHCRRAAEIKPDFHLATLNLGLILLSQGRYVEGWPYYEIRPAVRDREFTVSVPQLPFSQWRGESLQGKSLLLWPEQGFGDYVQFIRYASLLKDRGLSRLTVRCPAPLKALLQTAAGVDQVITDADPVSPHDYWSFPLSLPLHFGTTVETIPVSLPYLQAPPDRRERWSKRLPNGFKVGLVWKGSTAHSNDGNRSLPGLATLTPLWSIPGITFVSLQKGAGEDEARCTELPIVDLGSDIRDFADTAAIVEQLDLVICVDTAVAHVAGALGKPCWVLLPAIGCDWRWMRDRSDSPWYPGALRLFRQKERGDWSGVVDEMVSALAGFATSRPPQIPG